MDEAHLILRAQEGDAEAFRDVIEPYRRALFGAAFYITQDYGLAEDAVQEGLTRAWRALPAVQIESSFKAWLMKVVTNAAKSQFKRKRVGVVPLDEALHVTSAMTPGDLLLDREEKERLRSALDALKPEYREILMLKYYGDLSVTEVAEALGCRVGTVKSRLHRALNALGAFLGSQREERYGTA